MSWTRLKRDQSQPNRWQDFIDLWSGHAIGQWLAALAKMIDTIAEGCSPEQLDLMRQSFRAAIHYRVRFWEMVFETSDW